MIVAVSAAAGALTGAVAASLVWWHLWRSHAEAHHYEPEHVADLRDHAVEWIVEGPA